MRRSSVHLLCFSQRHCGWNQESQIWTHQTKGQIFTGLMFIARVSWPKQVFFSYWCPFSSGFFAAIWLWRPDSRSHFWTVDVEMCLLLELCEACIWIAIWGAVNSNELILCSRGNSGSSFPVEVPMKCSFIIEFDCFCECTWRNLTKFLTFSDWLTFMS